MNKKKIMIISASLLMLAAVSVKPAMAYFTDTHKAVGTVKFGSYEITPHEKVENNVKKITVENTGDYPVFARVKVLAGHTHDLEFDKSASKDWTLKDDGYYYYDNPIDVKELSSELVIKISDNADTDDADTFNVIVVEEATKVADDGTAKWDETTVNSEKFGLNKNNKGGTN
ncbi:MAG: hypothetical protein J5901_05330 [Pseudobutyrivibrio sp.]|nr:hypothetical protein [Pseudobutyrivibrio sp.]